MDVTLLALLALGLVGLAAHSRHLSRLERKVDLLMERQGLGPKDTFEAELRGLLSSGRRLTAIRRVHRTERVSYEEARVRVDALEERMEKVVPWPPPKN